MRVRKIIAFIMASLLVLSSLTLFSFAADTVTVNDSGSPEVSLMALRSIAADDGISLAAAEGNSGQFGYRELDVTSSFSDVIGDYQNPIYPNLYSRYIVGYVTSGFYEIRVLFNAPVVSYGSTAKNNGWTRLGKIYDNGYFKFQFHVPDGISSIYTYLNCWFSDDGSLPFDSLEIIDLQVVRYEPVEGISSGYTYSSGVIPNTTRSIFETLTPSFGNQPAGKYLVNIYHWGDSYDVKFHISDSTESYYLPTSTNGGVTTLVYNHPGGAFILDGSFTASNIETSVVEGDVDFNGGSLYGDLVADGPLSWVFNITDIVAIPYDQASDFNFGFFSPIIGFFRDQFSDMKSWIATHIDKIAGDDETKSDVDDAQSELQKEVEDLNNLSGQLDTQASNLEQQFTTDFAIPDTVSGQGTNFQSIYTSLFGSLGVFGIFIWLPIVMAVIKKLLRL